MPAILAAPSIMDQHIFSGITQFILNEQFVGIDRLQAAIMDARKEQTPIIQYLVAHKLLNGQEFAIKAAEFFDITFFDIEAFNIDFLPQKYLSENITNTYHCLPLHKQKNTLLLATSNPLALDAIKEYHFFSGLEVEQLIVEASALTTVIARAIKKSSTHALEKFERLEFNGLMLDIEGHETASKEEPDDPNEPIVKYINNIIADAINKEASDIHFEPYEQNYRIRYRIDGILQEILAPPPKIARRIASRIKIMAQLNIAERRIPQDGRFKLKISKKQTMDFRVSTCPVAFGEKVVLRILDQKNINISIDRIGFEAHQKEIYLSTLKKSQGMILVTGPTGSGKTVTLYAGLQIINTAEKNISTAENPVEMNIAGINQVQINNKQGLTFAAALRSFLRQDPDIVMIGEIRDFETADIAIKAAQTGHLVLSTLHTNSAPGTLNRLLDVGIPAYNIVSSVSLIIAQRLARKLCPECRLPDNEISKEQLLDMGIQPRHVEQDFTVFHPDVDGCANCLHGYRGRVGIYEVMPLSQVMKALIIAGKSTLKLTEQCKHEGIENLRQSALIKAVKGVTSIEEALRVTS